MAHWTVTLESDWVTTANANKIEWQPAANLRPQITGGLLASPGDERFLSRFTIDNNGLVVHLTALRSGGIIGGQQDLSTEWEVNHLVHISLGNFSFTLPDDDSIVDDSTEHYRYSDPTQGSGGTLFQTDLTAFIRDIDTLVNSQDAELTLWDGQGTRPSTFPSKTPDPDPVPDPDPEPGEYTAGDEIWSVDLVRYSGGGDGASNWIGNAPIPSAQLATALAGAHIQLTVTYLPDPTPANSIYGLEILIGTGSGNIFVSAPSGQDLSDELEGAYIQLLTPDGNTVLWGGVFPDDEDADPYDLTEEISTADLQTVVEQTGNIKLRFSERMTTGGEFDSKIYVGETRVESIYVGANPVTAKYIGSTRVF